jgi:hypothetical protein
MVALPPSPSLRIEKQMLEALNKAATIGRSNNLKTHTLSRYSVRESRGVKLLSP